MTTLNIHAQESKSRFSCLSASDPENIWRQERKKEISEYYISTEVKQTVAARPKGGADDGALAPVRRPEGGRPRFVWFLCFRSVLCFYFIFFPDVRDVFGIRGAQAWESTFRLLRMNVQGCHYILAVWFTYRIEDHDGFRPGAPSLFLSFFFVFMVKILDCFFLNICVPP